MCHYVNFLLHQCKYTPWYSSIWIFKKRREKLHSTNICKLFIFLFFSYPCNWCERCNFEDWLPNAIVHHLSVQNSFDSNMVSFQFGAIAQFLTIFHWYFKFRTNYLFSFWIEVENRVIFNISNYGYRQIWVSRFPSPSSRYNTLKTFSLFIERTTIKKKHSSKLLVLFSWAVVTVTNNV